MLTALVLAVVVTVGLWFTWNARTYGQRSTDAMLKARAPTASVRPMPC